MRVVVAHTLFPPPPFARMRGAALIIVLWTVAILSIVLLNFGFMSKTHLRLASNFSNTSILHNIAFAGVERSIAELKFDPEGSSDYLSETWADSQETFMDVPLGAGTFSVISSNTTDEGEPLYGLEDESAKLNLHTATREMLLSLPGMQQYLADALEDWQDADNQTKTEGAESEYYEMLLKPYSCKNGKLSTIHELLLVKGFNRSIVFGEDTNCNGILDPNENDGEAFPPYDNADGILDAGLLPYVTIHSVDKNESLDGQPRADINSASESVLRRTLPGLSSSEAKAIVAFRSKNKFKNLGDLLNVTAAPKEEKSKSDNTKSNNTKSNNTKSKNKDNSSNSNNRGSSNNSNNSSTSNNRSGSNNNNNSSSSNNRSGSNNNNNSSSSSSNNRSGSNNNNNSSSSSSSSNNRSGSNNNNNSSSSSSNNSNNRGGSNNTNNSNTKKDEKKKKDNKSSNQPAGSGAKIISSTRLKQIIDYCAIGKDKTTPGRININTASTQVLMTLPGMSERMANAIVAHREQSLGGFENIAELLDVPGISSSRFIPLSNFVTVRSFQFRVKSVARIEGLRAQRTIVAILDRSGDTIKTLYWNEY